MERKKRSAETLRKASDHLHYEIWMFMTVARSMATGVYGQGALNNAMLESFTIHARVLLDFFYSKRPQKDDVIAEDFFNEPAEWHNIRPEMTEILKKLNKRVGKEVAHLTYARQDITPEDKQWYLNQIAQDMSVVVNKFLANLPRELLGPRWNAAL